MSMLSLEAPPQKYLNDENIFKTVCSKKIVQPEDKKGFFKDYVANIIKSLKKEEVEKFSQLKTDRDRILFLYDVPAAHEIRIGNFYFHKNSIDCEKKRKAGNDMFAKGKYPEAILMYNHCIMKAPPDNENYSLALANRSAALFHLRHFAHALVDIAEALKHNYPKNLRFKLQDRRGCCYMNFGHRVEAAECFNAALADLEESDLCEKRKKQWTRELKDKIVIALQVDGAEPKEPKEKHAIPAVSGVWPNTMFPNACEAFSVMFHPAFGRYACASKPIRTGDVLLVEAPYASYPIVEKSSVLQTCHHCLKRFLVPVPCPACAGVAFCGVRCREEALATYHQTECNIMNLLVGSGMSITCFLAFRILTQSGMAYFRAMKDQLIKGPDEEKFLNSEGVYDAESYLSVFNLVSHEDQRSTADLLHKTVMAMFLLKCLQSVKFFGPEISSKDRHPLTDDEVLAGSILVRNLQVLQFNAHEISEFYMRKKGDFRGAKSVFIGAGIYPTASFFNHSCDPGIVRYFCGDKIIIRAIRNLEPGDMIAENYGPVFTRMPLEERQLTLRTRYWFDCQCQACTEDWPMFIHMRPDELKIKCQHCPCILKVDNTDFRTGSIACIGCSQSTNIMKTLKALADTEKIFDMGKFAMASGDTDKAIKSFVVLLNTLQRLLRPPFKDYHLTQEQLRRCLLSKGNVHFVDAGMLDDGEDDNEQCHVVAER